MKYVIVPIAEGYNNYRMLNRSTSSSFLNVRSNSINGEATKLLFELQSDTIPEEFLDYRIYSREEILLELENEEWQ